MESNSYVVVQEAGGRVHEPSPRLNKKIPRSICQKHLAQNDGSQLRWAVLLPKEQKKILRLHSKATMPITAAAQVRRPFSSSAQSCGSGPLSSEPPANTFRLEPGLTSHKTLTHTCAFTQVVFQELPVYEQRSAGEWG